MGEPLFYRRHKREGSLSGEFFLSVPLVQDIIGVVGARGYYPGHGMIHVRRVAIDTGAIPLSERLPRFAVGMEGIARIKITFRTAVGKMYGPDFIDRGLDIGRRLYAELTVGKYQWAGATSCPHPDYFPK